MRGGKVNKWVLGVCVWILLFGCQKLEDDKWGITKNGTLNVETRSVENDTIPYPMSLYAFSSSGECIANQTIESEDDDMQLRLPSGKYRIVAVAGYSKGYVMPSAKSWEDEIVLSADQFPETPLMMGMAEIDLDSETANELEIVLSYSVAAVDVILSGSPSEVTGVEVKASPFYASMNFKGEYKESDYSMDMVCSLDTVNRWVSKTQYVFPGSGEETVFSIAFTMKDGTKSTYGYVWKNSLSANQPYHLKGSYSGNLMLDGTFGITGWKESENIDFQFGSTNESGGGGNGSNTDPSDLPEVGRFWNGTLVADVGETDDDGTDVLLVSLDEWAVLTSEANEAASDYSVNGISEWRLPTYEEAQLLKNAFSGDKRLSLNERIAEYSSGLVGLSESERYLCLKADEFYSFAFAVGTNISMAGEKKTYRVRLVKSYRIKR